MKRSIVFSLLILFAFQGSGQQKFFFGNMYPWENWEPQIYSLVPPYSKKIGEQALKQLSIRKIYYTKTGKEKRSKRSFVNYFLDEKKQVLRYEYFKKDSTLSVRYSYQYNDKGLPTNQIIDTDKGPRQMEIKCFYNDRGKSVLYSYKNNWRNNKNGYEITSNYADTLLKERLTYTKGGKELLRKASYQYNEQNKLKQLQIFNKKEKLKHTWNYECTQQGKLENKHKDTSSICKSTETDEQGNRMEIRRETNAQGKVVKVVYVYQKETNKLMQMAIYHGTSNTPRNKIIYAYPGQPQKETITYDKKGHIKKHLVSEITFNEKGEITERKQYEIKKGKPLYKERVVTEYSEKGLVLSERYFDEKDRIKVSASYFFQ